MQAYNTTRNQLLAARLQWAGTRQERKRGLLGRPGLDDDQAIYIVPTQWVHTFGMRFSIDIAFLDGNGRVLVLHHDLKPNRLSRIAWRAQGALELGAGRLQATGTRVGDIILLSEDGPSGVR